MKRTVLWLTVVAVTWTTLGAIGAYPRFLEELAIGGGYGDAADGGASIDKAGNVQTDGNATVRGTLTAGTPLRAITTTAGELDGAALKAGSIGAAALDAAGAYTLSSLDTSGLRVIASTVNGPELVQNGGLEGVYVSGVAPSWVKDDVGGLGTYSKETVDVFAGSASQKVAREVTGAQTELRQYNLTIRDGKWYRLSFAAKVLSGRVSEVNMYGSANQQLLGPITGANWTQYSTTFQANCGANGVAFLRWRITTADTGTFLLDAISLVEITGGAAAVADDLRVGGAFRVAEATSLGDNLTVNGDGTFAGGDVIAGADSSVRGLISVWDGAGGNTPGCFRLASPNGTLWHFFVEDDGTFKVSSSLPSSNADGAAVGTQY